MQKYDTHSSCRNFYFGKNYPYFGFAENQSVGFQPLLQEAVGNVAAGIQKEFATEVDEIKIASSGQKKSF